MATQANVKIAAAVAVLALGGLAVWAVAPLQRDARIVEYAAPGMAPMDAGMAREGMFLLLPALLTQVYQGFAETEETAIYDTLAAAAHGAALETLYLQRAGAMRGGGLTGPDQEIHEMRLVNMGARQSGETFAVDAAWEVIGTVGHSEHMHVRGNTYRAQLTIAPVAGAWKITDFDLLDVDRQTAGELLPADPDET
jgi:hypothetical protein